jgi:hypothetical protein
VKDGFAKILFGISRESRTEQERGCLLLSANMERDAKDKVIAEFLLENQLKTEAVLAPDDSFFEPTQFPAENPIREFFTAQIDIVSDTVKHTIDT